LWVLTVCVFLFVTARMQAGTGGFSAGARYERERISEWKLDTAVIEAEYAWGDVFAPYVRVGAGRADVESGDSFQGEGKVFTAGAGLQFRRELSPWTAFADYRYQTLCDTGTVRSGPGGRMTTTLAHEAHELTGGVRYAIIADRLTAIAGVRSTYTDTSLEMTFANDYGVFHESTDVDLDHTEVVAGAELQITEPLSIQFEIAAGNGSTHGAVSLSWQFGKRPPSPAPGECPCRKLHRRTRRAP